QALENLLAQALRSKKINDKPLLEIAQGMVWNSGNNLHSRLYRIRSQPFRTPDEQYAADVLDTFREEVGAEEMIDVLENEKWGRLFFDMIDETYKMGSPPDFCAQMFAECMRQEERGAIVFNYTDSAGIEYVYHLA